MQYYCNIIAARSSGKELSKEVAERLIGFPPAPYGASVYEMIVIGQELAHGVYTHWICFGLEGQKAVAVAEESACGRKLVELTIPSLEMLEGEDREKKELVFEIVRAERFAWALFQTVQNGARKE